MCKCARLYSRELGRGLLCRSVGVLVAGGWGRHSCLARPLATSGDTVQPPTTTTHTTSPSTSTLPPALAPGHYRSRYTHCRRSGGHYRSLEVMGVEAGRSVVEAGRCAVLHTRHWPLEAAVHYWALAGSSGLRHSRHWPRDLQRLPAWDQYWSGHGGRLKCYLQISIFMLGATVATGQPCIECAGGKWCSWPPLSSQHLVKHQNISQAAREIVHCMVLLNCYKGAGKIYDLWF